MISTATKNDIPQLATLVNSAYRGEASKAGWTTEANIISGNTRTDETQMGIEFSDTAVTILKYTNAENNIDGCVYLKQLPHGLYLGMLCVNPNLQGSGIGKKLMQAAEVFAQSNGLTQIEMTVINVRTELIAWYQKLGYKYAGITKPFPPDAFGTPTRPLHFEVLIKTLA